MSEKRTELSNSMKDAMKSRDELTLNTIRMVIAKMKDQDIEARSKGNPDGITQPASSSLPMALSYGVAASVPPPQWSEKSASTHP